MKIEKLDPSAFAAKPRKSTGLKAFLLDMALGDVIQITDIHISQVYAVIKTVKFQNLGVNFTASRVSDRVFMVKRTS